LQLHWPEYALHWVTGMTPSGIAASFGDVSGKLGLTKFVCMLHAYFPRYIHALRSCTKDCLTRAEAGPNLLSPKDVHHWRWRILGRRFKESMKGLVGVSKYANNLGLYSVDQVILQNLKNCTKCFQFSTERPATGWVCPVKFQDPSLMPWKLESVSSVYSAPLVLNPQLYPVMIILVLVLMDRFQVLVIVLARTLSIIQSYSHNIILWYQCIQLVLIYSTI